MTRSQKKLWIGLIILALLSPLGVILPEKFRAGRPWGEWGPEDVERLLGYVPEGLRRVTGLWKAPVPDYDFGREGSSVTVQVISYAASGLVGILAVVLVIYLISRVIMKNGK